MDNNIYTTGNFATDNIRYNVEGGGAGGSLDLVFDRGGTGTTTICAAGLMGNTPLGIAGTGLRSNVTRTIVYGDNGTGAYGTGNVRVTRNAYGTLTRGLNVDRGSIIITSANIVKRPLSVAPVGGKVPRLVRGLNSGDFSTTRNVVAASAGLGRVTIRFDVGNGAYGVNNVTGNSNVVRPGVTAVLIFVAASYTVRDAVLRGTLSASVRDAFGVVSVSNSASAGSVIIILTGNVTRGSRVATSSSSFGVFVRTLGAIYMGLYEGVTTSNRNTAGLLRYGISGTRDLRITGAITGSIIYSSLAGTTVFNTSTG